MTNYEQCASGSPAQPDLLDRLHQGFGSGLIALEAPAGAGKTALLAEFVAGLECDPRYVHLDATCAVPEVLAERVLLALDPSLPRARSLVKLADLQSQITNALSNVGTDHPLVLIVDNLEHVAGHPEAMAVVEAIHEELPPYVELIVVGRCVPSPKLEKQAATNSCLWLTQSDFRLSPKSPLHVVNGDANDHQPSGQPVVSAIAGLAEPIDHVLRILGCMPGFTSQFLDETFGIETSRSVAAVLASNPEICEPEFQAGTWHLHRPVHPGGVETTEAGSFEEITVAACSQLLNRGLPYSAAELAVQARSHGATSLVLAELGAEALREGSFTILRRLTDERFATSSHPIDPTDGLGTCIRARVEASAGDPLAALRLVDSARQDGHVPVKNLVHLLLAETEAARVSADMPRAAAAAEQLQSAAIGETSPERFDAAIGAGDYFLFIRSDTGKARGLYNEALRLAEELEHLALIPIAEGKLGDLAYTEGDIPAAVQSLEQAATRWEQLGCTSRLPRAFNNLGMAYASSGEISSALAAYHRAVGAAHTAHLDVREAYALASLAELELDFGDAEKARGYLNQAMSLCSGGVIDERLRALILADLAICDLSAGRNESANRQSSRSAILAETSAGPVDRAICQMKVARVKFAMDLRTEAEATLEEAIAVFEAAGAQAELLNAQVFLAAFAFEDGNTRRAKQRMKQVASTAKHGCHQGVLLAALRQQHAFADWVRDHRFLSGHLDESAWTSIETGRVITDVERPDGQPEEIVYNMTTGARTHRWE